MSIDSSIQSSRISSPSPVSTMSDTNTTSSMIASSSATSLLNPFTTTSASSSPSPELDPENVISASEHSSPTDVDPLIIEALKSKDRIYVLKLGEQMELLINERRTRLELTPATSYQRLLVHRCSAYHRLTIENDPSSKNIAVLVTSESRIPSRRLADLVPPESSIHPAITIIKRKQQSQAGSVAGEDADLSDVEPSESGSLGGRSNTSKKHMTIEQREAAYNEARSRIFMDFEEKDKDKDASASSSSLSLASESASVGDFDDSASSLAESERSGPSYSRELRRSANASVTPSTSRSFRSPATNASNSSRNSRAPSPSSFSYASLYEPSPPVPYDQGAGPTYQPVQYIYPPGQPPNQAFMHPPQYQYYHPYPYPSPPSHPNDPTSPVHSPDLYSPPLHHGNPYMWHPQQPQTMSAPNLTGGPVPMQNSNPPHVLPQHPQGVPFPQAPYMHHPMYSYPFPGYYTPQPSQPMPLPGPMMYEAHRSMPTLYAPNGAIVPNSNHDIGDAGDGNQNPTDSHDRHNGNPHNTTGNGVKVRPPLQPLQPKQAWSFGPGIGMGGVPYGNGHSSNLPGGAETIGPRFNSVRRLSNNSNGNGGLSRNSSNCDEASSTASSSTSSSSRRTFTSSTSSTSQHPLPARPDWAVGLKPDNTLHPSTNRHHHDHHGQIRNNGTMPQQMSPRNPSKQRQPPLPHSTDFPPLSASDANQRRAPLVSGAWTNPSSTRSILSPPPHQGNPLVYHPVSGPMMNGMGGNMTSPVGGSMQIPPMTTMLSRLDDPDRIFERPPPKATAELYNPKVPPRRPINMATNGRQNSQDKMKAGLGDVNGLVDQLNLAAINENAVDHQLT